LPKYNRSTVNTTPTTRHTNVTVHTELIRGAGPVAVLQLLAAREMYGYELVGALDEQTAGVLAMGQSTLYPMLYHMEAKGLIRGRWRKSESGRRRKYYGMTAAGQTALRRHREEWRDLFGAMRDIGLLGGGA
jgi:PadR family transcriptional regulator PadR